MKYLIVIDQTKTGCSAYSPDLPGCIATGSTRDEVEREMKGAIVLHLDGLKAEVLAIAISFPRLATPAGRAPGPGSASA
jgi:predicted RNase H-like HicB family nuclease